MWEFNSYDFGESKLGSIKNVQIRYQGNQELNESNFGKSCGCTTPSYNAANKILTAWLNMDVLGNKTSTIFVNYPNGQQELITLKAKITAQ